MRDYCYYEPNENSDFGIGQYDRDVTDVRSGFTQDNSDQEQKLISYCYRYFRSHIIEVCPPGSGISAPLTDHYFIECMFRDLSFIVSPSQSLVVVNTVASFTNRSLMGAAQENCEIARQWKFASLFSDFTGFYDTLSQSKARGAIWRVVGSVVFNLNYIAGF